MEVRRYAITITAGPDAPIVADLADSFERLLARALAIIEDELRHKFGDIDVEVA